MHGTGRTTRQAFVIGLAASLLAAAAARASGSTIAGVALDEGSLALPGVTITVAPVGGSAAPSNAWTDIDGSFSVSGLAPGTYTVEASLEGFQVATTEVKLVVDQTVRIEFRMAMAKFGETLEVKAEAVKTSEVAILDERRQAAAVSDAISSEEISRTPDADAAGVVERLTGVSVVSDKYVFVRGLGERYSNTTLNGAAISTTEPEKRVVPLDLFPARMLDSINVVKTYTPDRPGDFGGGLVELNTLDFPTDASLRVALGASYDALSTGEGLKQYVGGLSWNGSGGQPLPSSMPDELVVPSSPLGNGGFSPQELEALGESLQPHWEADTASSAPYNGNFNIAYGDTIGNLGLVVSAMGSHGYDLTEEVQKFYGLDADEELTIRNDYAMGIDSEEVRNGLVGNFSLRLTDNNRVTLNSVFSRNATGESRQTDGYNSNAGQIFRDFRLRYQVEEVFSNRLSGEHVLSGIGLSSLVEWSVSRSEATNDSDQRESLYYEIEPGVYALQGSSESGKAEYFGLEDTTSSAVLGWTTFYGNGSSRYGSLKAGLAYNERTRDFGARRFRFVTNDPNQFDLTLSPNELFTADNIRPGGFEIREFTSVNDAYDAEHTVAAGYVMADATFGPWRFIGGVRYEDSDQTVVSYDPFSPDQAESRAENLNTDLLPALNVVYQISPATNVRLGASRTVNRPEFRELSPFQYTEVTGGRSMAGNPDLHEATIDSVDLRWEHFPEAGEVVAASAFFKRIDSPIEQIIQPTTELRTSFTNAESATLWGAELEFRRSLATLTPALRWWALNLNYSYVRSDVTIGEQDLSVVTNTNRPLEGQSEHVGNFGVQFHQPSWGTFVRVLYNYTGERISDVGAYGLPDIYEGTVTSLDIILSQQLRFLADGLEIKAAASNLLDADREYTQAGQIHRRYLPGRSFSLALGYTIF